MSPLARRGRAAIGLSLLIAAPLRAWVTALLPSMVHPLDPAEMKFADPDKLARLYGGLSAAAELIAGHENIHHGGFLTVQLLSELLAKLVEAALGEPEPLLALRLLGLLLGLTVTAAWAWAGARLGAHPLLAALAAALLPLWGTQGALVAWGSHAEAGLWIALSVGALAAGRRLAAAAALGAAAGWDGALAPSALLLIIFALGPGPTAARLRRLGAALLGALPFLLPRLLAGGDRLWTLGLTEAAQRRPLDLLIGAIDPLQLDAALRALGGLRWLPRDDATAPLAAVGLGLAGLGLLWRSGRPQGRGAGEATTLLLAGPALHILTLALFSPLRPAVQHRYLLPYLPAVALWPAVLAPRLPPPLRAAAVTLALGLAGAELRAHLGLEPTASLDARRAYIGANSRPGWQWAAQRGGLEQLHPASAPALRALYVCRAAQVGAEHLDQDAVWRGALAATDRRWGYPVLGEAPRTPQPSPELQRRVAELSAEGLDPAALWRGVGAGLATLRPVSARRVDAAISALPTSVQGQVRPSLSTPPCD